MEEPQVTQELKNDLLGLVERVDGPGGSVVRRVACGGKIPGSGFVARKLLQRERRALSRLEGIEGVSSLVEDPSYRKAPSQDGSVPRSEHVLVRRWVDGMPLQETCELPRDFFDRLEELVREIHSHGVCHNDLHKEANILVGEDGYPFLVDFQLASLHENRDRTFLVRVLEDLRHVEKHRWKYTTQGRPRGDGKERRKERRSTLAHVWLRYVKPPYLFVTRRVFGYQGGERGRPRSGPWPEWTPPVGPRS